MTGARALPRSPKRWAYRVPRCTGTCPSRLPASHAVRHPPGQTRAHQGYGEGPASSAGDLLRPEDVVDDDNQRMANGMRNSNSIGHNANARNGILITAPLEMKSRPGGVKRKQMARRRQYSRARFSVN